MSQYEYMVKITVNSESDLLAEEDHSTVTGIIEDAFAPEDDADPDETPDPEVVSVEVTEARMVPTDQTVSNPSTQRPARPAPVVTPTPGANRPPQGVQLPADNGPTVGPKPGPSVRP
jgi:hypothetical protein